MCIRDRVCDFCGSSYDTAEIEALYAEKEAAAETAAQNKQAPPPDLSLIHIWSPLQSRSRKPPPNQPLLPLLRTIPIIHRLPA